MLNEIKHLWLAIALIAAATAILLLSDSNRRNGTPKTHTVNSFPTANAIAPQMVHGNDDVLITSSTIPHG